jgi:transcriptional regulator with XRE-family HTH domain
MAQEQLRPEPKMSDEDILKGIGMRLRNLRMRRELDQEEVQAATGIGVSTLSRYERGRAKYPEIVKL